MLTLTIDRLFDHIKWALFDDH